MKTKNSILLLILNLILYYPNYYEATVWDEDYVHRDGQLVFVAIINSVGDHAPLRKPLFSNQSDWPNGLGQLTDMGKQKQTELGHWLRKRYVGNVLTNNTKFSAVEVADELTILSADSNLARTSAAATLSGMFPLRNYSQLISSAALPADMSWLTEPNVAEEKCPIFDQLYWQLIQSEQMKVPLNAYETIFDYYTTQIGEHADANEINADALSQIPLAVRQIYETMIAESAHNFSLPEWTRLIFPSDKLEFAATLTMVLPVAAPEMARLRHGILLKQILDLFARKTKPKQPPTKSVVRMYSAFPDTIAGLLHLLRIYENHEPPSAGSSLLFELRRYKNLNYVQVFYRISNGTSSIESADESLYIPQCGRACPLQKWFNLFGDSMPTGNQSEECRRQQQRPIQLTNIRIPTKLSRSASLSSGGGFATTTNIIISQPTIILIIFYLYRMFVFFLNK